MKAVAAVTLCGAFLLATAPPAVAAPASTLRVLIAIKGGPTKAVTLTCDPSGGDHPSPQAACRVLQKIGGDLSKLNVVPKPVCTKEMRPHAVVVAGKWKGKPVTFGHAYANYCLVKAAGGALFSLF